MALHGEGTLRGLVSRNGSESKIGSSKRLWADERSSAQKTPEMMMARRIRPCRETHPFSDAKARKSPAEVRQVFIVRETPMSEVILKLASAQDTYGNIAEQNFDKWTHWDLNPWPSACEADVIPLHHVPSEGRC